MPTINPDEIEILTALLGNESMILLLEHLVDISETEIQLLTQKSTVTKYISKNKYLNPERSLLIATDLDHSGTDNKLVVLYHVIYFIDTHTGSSSLVVHSRDENFTTLLISALSAWDIMMKRKEEGGNCIIFTQH